MSQDFFTKTLFPSDNDGATGQMLVQGKRGLNHMDKKVIVVILVVVLVLVMLPVLFAPMIPVQVTTTESSTRKLLSYYKSQSADDSSYSDYVNVTNYDSVGGTYTVTLQRTSGPWDDYETFEDTTQSMFIDAGDSGIFYAPEGWMYFTIEVDVPTKQVNYNVTTTEYHSIIDLIT